MKVNFAFFWKSRSQSLEEEWRDTESMLPEVSTVTQSVMIWAAMSSAGVGPLCFLKYTVNAAIYQEILEHFMLPSADKLYGDADFIFQQDLHLGMGIVKVLTVLLLLSILLIGPVL